MKIGIVTRHDALNAGAILQAYALQTCLEKMGHQVEFIDYRIKRKIIYRDFIAKTPIAIIHKWKNLYNRSIYNNRGNWNYCLKRSARKYFSFEDLKNNPPEYDAYIVGSDQVWNFYKRISPVELLDFVPVGKKKIAYAASMGQCCPDKSIYRLLRDRFLSFDALSLREKEATDFVKSLVGDKPVFQTLDPTLLLDSSDYNTIIDYRANSRFKYICSYILFDLDNSDIKTIQYIHSNMRYKLLNLRNPDTCIWLTNASNIITTPYQWLCYIKNSEFIISGSFHATVFALIFHKPFVVLTINKKSGGNVRINSLLESVNLSNHIIYDYDKDKIDSIIHDNINWEMIDAKIKELRVNSVEFLKSSLVYNVKQ